MTGTTSRTTTTAPSADRAMMKKLRMMIQTGVPMDAVEHRAKLAGIDLAMVLGEEKQHQQQQQQDDNNDTKSKDVNAIVIIPTPLIKKYKRMMNSGVPLMGIQAQAFVDGKFAPEDVLAVLADVMDKKKIKNMNDDDYYHQEQYQVPRREKRQVLPRRNTHEVNPEDGAETMAFSLMEAAEAAAAAHFQVVDGKDGDDGNGLIEFPGDSLLAALVRKMVQTVKKRATAVTAVTTTTTTTMTVDSLTLYHALGALQGVQLARDRYNNSITTASTTTGSNTGTDTGTTKATKMTLQEIKAQRQGFVEIAKTIGMDLPNATHTTTIKDLGFGDETTGSDGIVVIDIAGLDELVQHIQTVYAKELQALQEMLKEGWYDFDSLAMLYTPGSKVIAKNAGGGGVDMMCQVAWNRYEQGRTLGMMGEQPTKYFRVCFHFVVALSSSQATIVEVVEGMESFEGRRSIDSSSALTFVPLSTTGYYSPHQQEELLARYRRRGELYNRVALCGKHAYMNYDKGSFFLKRTGGGSWENHGTSTAAALATGGRILVDTQGAYDNGHSLGVGYDPMVTSIKYKYKEYQLHLRAAKQREKGAGETGKFSIAKHRNHNDTAAAVAGGGGGHDGSLVLFDQVPNDFLDMVWPLVVGFSLTAKGWGDVLVDGLDDIVWQEDIFERLVLPENRKTMVKALVRHTAASAGGGSLSSDSNKFHDLVPGKGEGTLFLLYGPPGVGKTLTAEAVAELLHKPLYSLSLGTLGTTAGELERRLGEIMNLSAKWDALILLDEADSFLETRSSQSSLERNAMVSVMLKLVEYFSGILFLTSNRIDSLDPAFQTRITLALRYEPLDAKGRGQVWKNLLIKSDLEHLLEDGTLDPLKLGKASSLNGREIKNALRLAMAMAMETGQSLSQTLLLETIEIVNDYKVTTTTTTAAAAASGNKKNAGSFFSFFPWRGKK